MTTREQRPRQVPEQQDMFGAPPERGPEAPVRPAVVAEQLTRIARRLPQNLRLGTSSWSYTGWAGIVYADAYSTSVLARHGLAAYAQHPLLTGVGLDRTFYSPVSAAELARYAAVVPENFRFVAKAFSGLTTAPDNPRAIQVDGRSAFLDADLARRAVIEPLVEAFGPKLGAVLFQFSPLGPRYTNAPGAFIERLGEFLQALPRGVDYAVELRDSDFLGPQYESMLSAVGATHCASIHPRMPPVDHQIRSEQGGTLVIRWMLHPGQDYEAAAVRYAPFNRLVDPDPVNRERVVKLIERALSAGRNVHVVAANKAEGSAPLTLVEIAKAVASTQRLGECSRSQPW